MHKDQDERNTSKGVTVSRRNVLIGGAVTIAAPYIITSRARAAANQLVLCFSGGTTQTALEETIFKQFREETGIELTVVNEIDPAKLKAQVDAKAVVWDLFDYVGPALMQLGSAGYLDEIDPSVFKGAEMFDNPSPWMVGYGFYAGGVCYDPTRNPKHANNFPDFWDVEQFPGRRGLRLRSSETMECALLGDGVAAKDMYPLDVDRAFKALERIKPNIRKWIEVTQQTVDLVTHGELDYSYTYLNRTKAASDAGLSIELAKQQMIIYGSYYCSPKGAPHRTQAMEYIEFVLSHPKNLAAFCERMAVIPGNLKANEFLDEKAKKELPDLKDPNHVIMDVKWWGENYKNIEPRFKEFILT